MRHVLLDLERELKKGQEKTGLVHRLTRSRVFHLGSGFLPEDCLDCQNEKTRSLCTTQTVANHTRSGPPTNLRISQIILKLSTAASHTLMVSPNQHPHQSFGSTLPEHLLILTMPEDKAMTSEAQKSLSLAHLVHWSSSYSLALPRNMGHSTGSST